MFIKHLEVENWKCFHKKKVFDFDLHELICQKNGTGKTSIFEAILFVIWDKKPVGFDLNSVRYDYNEKCRIFIQLDMNGNNLEIERIFGSKYPIYELKINGDLICESNAAIKQYMNQIMNVKIVEQIWTGSLVESDMLNVNYFKQTVLSDILNDPNKILIFYKGEVNRLNKKISSFNSGEILDSQKIKHEMDAIKSKLQEKDESNILLAKQAKNAYDDLNSIDLEYRNKLLALNLEMNEVNHLINLHNEKDKIKKDLEIELSKKDTIYSQFNAKELLKILNASESYGKCVICNSDFNSDHKTKIISEINKSGRSEENIKNLQEKLNKINSVSLNDLKNLKKIYDLNSIIEKCKDFEIIINNYSEENSKLWEKYESLQSLYAKSLKQAEDLKGIKSMRLRVDECNEKIDAIKTYISDANAYYTSNIMDKASDYLIRINSRYKGICIYDDCFNVMVEDENFATKLLPVGRLSKGEKTICSLSILFAIHSLTVPELPFLFDETFSALDTENLEQVKRFLRMQTGTQIFIITHDTTWKEF